MHFQKRGCWGAKKALAGAPPTNGGLSINKTYKKQSNAHIFRNGGVLFGEKDLAGAPSTNGGLKYTQIHINVQKY